MFRLAFSGTLAALLLAATGCRVNGPCGPCGGGGCGPAVGVAYDGCGVDCGGCGECDPCCDVGCGDCGDCGLCCGGPLGFGMFPWLHGSIARCLSCESGCGEVYYNEWVNDPPDCCDPCDNHGNFIGRQACAPFSWIHGLWGYRFNGCCNGCETGCGDCMGGCDGCDTGCSGCGDCGGGMTVADSGMVVDGRYADATFNPTPKQVVVRSSPNRKYQPRPYHTATRSRTAR